MFFKNEDEITICSNHQEYPTPLIWTFAFNGAEYWCPACGCHEGMLGAGTDVKWNWTLQDRLVNYEKASRKYLNANSALICSYMTRKGKRIKFIDLPLKAKQYYISQSKKWNYKFETL